MQISKNSWHYRVAYGLTSKEKRSDVTNLCRYFWRFILHLFIIWPSISIVMASFCGFVFFIGFWSARKINLSTDYPSNLLTPFKRWPSVKGHRIYPISVLVILAFPWIAWWLFEAIESHLILSVGIIIAVSLAVAGSWRLIKSETSHLVKEWLKAKKDKACPLIDFVD